MGKYGAREREIERGGGEYLDEAMGSFECGKLMGTVNPREETLTTGIYSMQSNLTLICNNMWQTGLWPTTTWTKSVIVTISMKGNLQLCQTHRTISLFNHPKQGYAENNTERSTTVGIHHHSLRRRSSLPSGSKHHRPNRECCAKSIYSTIRTHSTSSLVSKSCLYIVWHATPWAMMKRITSTQLSIHVIKKPYDKATSAS